MHRRQGVAPGRQVSVELQVQVAFQAVGDHFDLSPLIDQGGAGVHPIEPVLAGGFDGPVGIQTDGDERDGVQPCPGLDQRKLPQLIG